MGKKWLFAIAFATLFLNTEVFALTVTPGYDPAATMYGAVRYRNLNSGSGGEVYLGKNLGAGGATNRVEIDFYGTADCNGVTGYGAWNNGPPQLPGSNHVKFTYTPSSGKLRTEVQASRFYCKEFTIATGLAGNYIKLDVSNRAIGTTVNFNNVTVNGQSAGNFTGAGFQNWKITGVDLSTGLTLEGDIVLAGTQPGGETNKVEIGFGYSVPPDNEGPATSDVEVTPTPACLNGPATVTATVDDTETGASNIASAQYSLNGGTWYPMTASDGSFSSPTEGVTAGFDAQQIGANNVCVKGTDALTNAGAQTCQSFVVNYDFTGFFQPIDNTAVNSARAGQAIPAKWRIMDCAGNPIEDSGSFVALVSYPVDCADFTGNPSEAVDEYASGESGLIYHGDGYWQFNWKTPKKYSGTCRAMYVEFAGGSASPVAKFQFK